MWYIWQSALDLALGVYIPRRGEVVGHLFSPLSRWDKRLGWIAFKVRLVESDRLLVVPLDPVSQQPRSEEFYIPLEGTFGMNTHLAFIQAVTVKGEYKWWSDN
jgi:hypothetical protein